MPGLHWTRGHDTSQATKRISTTEGSYVLVGSSTSNERATSELDLENVRLDQSEDLNDSITGPDASVIPDSSFTAAEPLPFTLEGGTAMYEAIRPFMSSHQCAREYWRNFDISFTNESRSTELSRILVRVRNICVFADEVAMKTRVVLQEVDRSPTLMMREAGQVTSALEELYSVGEIQLHMHPSELLQKALCAEERANRLDDISYRLASALYHENAVTGLDRTDDSNLTFQSLWRKIRGVNAESGVQMLLWRDAN